MKHPNYVKGFDGTFKELAKSEGNMDYGSVAESYREKVKDIKSQAEGDEKRGNPKLAKILHAVSENLFKAQKGMEDTWKICKPHTNKNKK